VAIATPTAPISARKARAGTPARPGSEDPAPGRVAEIQRQRILGAIVDVAGERGAANVTVAHVVARAGISRRTFYELFEDREACLLSALEEAIGAAAAVVLPAYEAERGWRERIRAGLAALLAFLEDEPGLGRLCVVEALGAGDMALARRAHCMALLIAAVDEGRAEVRGDRQPPPMTAEGVVGAVFSIVHARILQRDAVAVPLTDLAPALMAAIVLPYLGRAAAQRELRQPTPRPRARPRPRRDPLEGLEMRLTYRTVRVLTAIAEHPEASNRLVAEGSGIADQGQISKLLTRLEGLGLIVNRGKGQPRGAPNAWHLTPRGTEVERAVHLQSAPEGRVRG
jgi:AcrR family transcriptional regulator/DNA-binding MarR family transcriptional regulator